MSCENFKTTKDLFRWSRFSLTVSNINFQGFPKKNISMFTFPHPSKKNNKTESFSHLSRFFFWKSPPPPLFFAVPVTQRGCRGFRSQWVARAQGDGCRPRSHGKPRCQVANCGDEKNLKIENFRTEKKQQKLWCDEMWMFLPLKKNEIDPCLFNVNTHKKHGSFINAGF